MNYYYCTDICETGKSGKEKATNEKLEVLNSFPNFKTLPFKRPSKNNYLQFFLFDLRLCWFIIKKDNSIVIIERLSWGFLSLICAYFKGIVVISDIHADAIEENALLRKGIKKIFYSCILSFKNNLQKKVNGYIINHPNLVSIIDSSKPYLISYNGVSHEKLVLKQHKKNVFINKKVNKILFIGSGAIWHGLNQLVESWLQLEDINWQLNIVGNVSTKNNNGSILYHGPKYDKDLEKIINDCDAFILPVLDNRLSPGSPLKLYEYLINKKPILTFKMEGYSDEIERYGIGFFGDLFDSKILKKLLLDLNNYKKSLVFKKNIHEITWDYRLKKWDLWIEQNFQ